MLDKLAATERQYEELVARLGSAELQSDATEYRKQAKTLAEIEPLVERFREYKQVTRDIAQTEELMAAGDPEMRGGALSGITAEPGWFTRAELVARYAEKSGRDISGLGYYEVFGLFKLGVILQQIYFRYHRGQTRDARFRDFHLRVRGLMRAAVELAEHLG